MPDFKSVDIENDVSELLGRVNGMEIRNFLLVSKIILSMRILFQQLF